MPTKAQITMGLMKKLPCPVSELTGGEMDVLNKYVKEGKIITYEVVGSGICAAVQDKKKQEATPSKDEE